MHTSRQESKLTTYNIPVICAPAIITYSPPSLVDAYFNSTLMAIRAINKPDITVATIRLTSCYTYNRKVIMCITIILCMIFYLDKQRQHHRENYMY